MVFVKEMFIRNIMFCSVYIQVLGYCEKGFMIKLFLHPKYLFLFPQKLKSFMMAILAPHFFFSHNHI